MSDKLLLEWNFIKNIPKGMKPCFYDKTLISANEWFVTLKRRWKGEVGEKGVIYLNSLIDITKDYCLNNKTNLKEIRTVLIDSIIGIKNLVYTYNVESQINVANDYNKCISKIQDLINEIDKMKKSFFGYSPKLIN